MKQSKVVVPWQEGLHLRRAASLVRVANFFRSSIRLRYGSQIADLRSIVSIISLCASMGTALEVEVRGDDEVDAVRAVEHVFSSQSPDATIDRITRHAG